MIKSAKSILALSAALLLASCGGANSAASSEEESQKESSIEEIVESSSEEISSGEKELPTGPFVTEPTTIYFWNGFNDNYRSVISNIIEAFKEVEPNITVEHDDIKQSGNYDMVMQSVIDGFSANNYPDLVVAYPDRVQDIINANRALDVEPYMYDAENGYGYTEDDLDDIIPSYLHDGSNYSVPGVYSMPFCKSTEVMYYNARIETLDLSVIDPTINDGDPITEEYLNDLTWEDFWGHLIPALETYNNNLPADQKLYGQDANYPAIVGYDSDDNLFITLAEQYGYGYTSVDQITGEGILEFNNDGMKALAAQFREYYQKGWFQTQGTSGSYTSKLFQPGNCLFCVGSTAGVSNQNGSTFQTKVCNLPRPEGGERRIIDQGPSMAFLDHDDDNRALASWLFYKFLTNAENNAAWAINANYLPIRYSTYDTSAYANISDPKGKAPLSLALLKAYQCQYQYEAADYLFTTPVFTGSAKARKEVGKLLTTIMTDAEADIDELFVEAIGNTLQDM